VRWTFSVRAPCRRQTTIGGLGQSIRGTLTRCDRFDFYESRLPVAAQARRRVSPRAARLSPLNSRQGIRHRTPSRVRANASQLLGSHHQSWLCWHNPTRRLHRRDGDRVVVGALILDRGGNVNCASALRRAPRAAILRNWARRLVSSPPSVSADLAAGWRAHHVSPVAPSLRFPAISDRPIVAWGSVEGSCRWCGSPSLFWC
jgi:hypothetical protein